MGAQGTTRLSTARLILRPFGLEDAPFVLRLLNEPSFLRFIGDKQVRDVEAARRYLREGPLASYEQHGHGLLLVEHAGAPIGMCGLLKRESLDAPDLGFAFVPEAEGQKLAQEAATAVMADATKRGLSRVLAIALEENVRSTRLLERLGFTREGRQYSDDGNELLVYAWSSDGGRIGDAIQPA